MSPTLQGRRLVNILTVMRGFFKETSRVEPRILRPMHDKMHGIFYLIGNSYQIKALRAQMRSSRARNKSCAEEGVCRRGACKAHFCFCRGKIALLLRFGIGMFQGNAVI